MSDLDERVAVLETQNATQQAEIDALRRDLDALRDSVPVNVDPGSV